MLLKQEHKLTHACRVIFHVLLSSVDFLKKKLKKNLAAGTEPCSGNILDLDQVQCFVWPYLGSNCMKRSAADDYLSLADSS